MATSKAQQKATMKYMRENLDEIRFRVKKGKKAEYQEFAESQGESLTAFIIKAINEKMERDGQEGD